VNTHPLIVTLYLLWRSNEGREGGSEQEGGRDGVRESEGGGVREREG